MPRYSCVISYDGGKFCGWQTQPNGATVQESLERVLSLLNGSPVKVTGAGRTDAGVHARGQTASFLLDREWEPRRLLLALNANLPEGAAVASVRERPIGFDARRDALWREYAFFVWRGPFCYPMMKPYVWWKKKDDWDHDLIRRGCALLEGRHDFSAFCRAGDLPENAVRRMHFVRYIRRGRLSAFRIRGDAFLTNMVRIMIGNLDAVASGRRTLSWLEGLLDGASRGDSAMTAPPNGLFFWKVGYKD
ncbi:tRNA pseudouridine synthase A [Pyramidobacter piscolens W5455]|uniref:tRNA pseudouridine synthase A n=1 Tax=Pyramidobacter piscolens W5455 TaxID=352165 RepID=A0ABM9ZTB5_9BACT|nr:tRNA pseudouridine(38-40) synthase TruA [Pyramidobacter piscolens]EFB90162.1 tRNA pseudouridine synthase A [Pyramidobacter piscolens W5455]BDF77829.1 tRNA pseudouridine synthase A [Pyramidobacter piscolens]